MNKNRFNLRMVAAMVACLAATTMCASCDKNGDQGDDPQDGGIVGVWVMGNPFLSLEKAIQWIEFKSNGTFSSSWNYNPSIFNPYSGNPDLIIYKSGMMYDRINTPGIITYKGKYRLSGDKITLTNVTNSYKVSGTSLSPTSFGGYSDQTTDDMVLDYELWAGGEKHDNTYTEYDSMKLPKWSSAQRRLYRQTTAKGIELWPEILPDFLYPSGFNGDAQAPSTETNLRNMFDVADALEKGNNPWIKFYVHIHNATSLTPFQSYRNKLIANGLDNTTYASTIWWFKGNIVLNGRTYELDIHISESYSDVTMSYEFHSY